MHTHLKIKKIRVKQQLEQFLTRLIYELLYLPVHTRTHAHTDTHTKKNCHAPVVTLFFLLQLKAYVSHKTPEVRVARPTAEDILKSMRPEELPKPKEQVLAIEEKVSS